MVSPGGHMMFLKTPSLSVVFFVPEHSCSAQNQQLLHFLSSSCPMSEGLHWPLWLEAWTWTLPLMMEDRRLQQQWCLPAARLWGSPTSRVPQALPVKVDCVCGFHISTGWSRMDQSSSTTPLRNHLHLLSTVSSWQPVTVLNYSFLLMRSWTKDPTAWTLLLNIAPGFSSHGWGLLTVVLALCPGTSGTSEGASHPHGCVVSARRGTEKHAWVGGKHELRNIQLIMRSRFQQDTHTPGLLVPQMVSSWRCKEPDVDV